MRHLEQVCFPKDNWPLLDIIAILTLPNIIRLKAVIDSEMVGFIAGDRRPPKGVAWIATLGVLPAHRHQGIGSALLSACEERIPDPRVRLTVRRNNETAQSLYKRCGYDMVGTWQRYYQDGSDALVFEKRL